MASRNTKFKVGIFVLVGLFIGISAVVYFGLSGFLEKGHYYAAYFDESVQGLAKDSSVKYRGVTVGRVDSIGVAPDNTLIEVILKIEQDIELTDIVAQLKSVGITGIMFVELDVKKPEDSDNAPKIMFKPQYSVIDTKPSDLKKYMASVENILNQLNSLDVKGISDRAISTLDNVNHTIESLQAERISADIQNTFKRLDKILDPTEWQMMLDAFKSSGQSMEKLIANVNDTVLNLNNTITRVDGIVKNNEEELTLAIKNITDSMDEASLFLSQGSDLIDTTDKTVQHLHRYLIDTLQNLERASRHLNQSMEQIADQPSTLIFSEPPDETKK